jgi:ADP-heptose:LPS heptosyltransferase
MLLGHSEEIYLDFYKKRLNDNRIEVIFSPDKDALMKLLRSAALYVGHDSGITHLAAMTGSPTVALFKSSNVDQWRPLGPQVEVIVEKESSLNLIEEVLRGAQKFLSQTPRQRLA